DDLTVVPDDFLMQSDLGLLGPTVVAGARRDGHQEWIVTGRNMQSIRLRAVSAGTLPSQSLTFAPCPIIFPAPPMPPCPITTRPITASICRCAARSAPRPATLPAHKLVAPSSLRRGDPSNVLEFTQGAEMRARLGVFAAKQDGVERAALLLVPPSGAPDRVLVGITYVFAQSAHNLEVFNGLGWSNPL